jgi:flagellar basal body rod protein FlgG
MPTPIDAVSRALSNDVTTLDVISQNVANMRTPGYRSEQPFSARTGAASHGADPGVDLSDGAVQATGHAEDIALQGAGFFAVDLNGTQALERNGALHLDSDRQLVDVAGRPVIGQDGPIVVDGPAFKVDSDGTVSVDGKAIDQLTLVGIGDPRQVRELGHGLYAYDGEPVDWKGSVRQGALEQSNVDASGEMVQLLEVTRHAQAVRHAIQAYDEAMQSGINHLGESS